MEPRAIKAQINMQSLSLVAAPLLLMGSTFFWNEGEYNTTASTLIIVSMFFWIPAFTGAYSLFKNKMPYYSVWGLWVAVFGCISGVCFAFLGYLTSVFNISHQEYLEALSHYPVTSQLLLFASGPLFPLSVLILGINFFRTKIIPQWIAVLFCFAGIAFPLSRISRIIWIAHIADLLLLIPAFYIAFKIFKSEEAQSSSV